MTKKTIKLSGLFIVLPALLLIITGCGKSVSQVVSEKATEKLIEKQIGGNTDVDINSGNVKMETKDGKFESGTNVKLPADFPSDVYVIEGNITAAISDQTSESFTISIETNKSVEEASAIYQEKFKSDGWKITGTMNFGDSSSVIAENDKRTVSVMIGKGDGKTSVVLSVGKK